MDDANEAGGTRSQECTLIVTEGDSAKALAVAGLSELNKNFYGVFPLKGKVLNVRDAPHRQVCTFFPLTRTTNPFFIIVKWVKERQAEHDIPLEKFLPVYCYSCFTLRTFISDADENEKSMILCL